MLEIDGRVQYLVRDLRSGEERHFIDERDMQAWLGSGLRIGRLR